jgi:hypothetical protein
VNARGEIGARRLRRFRRFNEEALIAEYEDLLVTDVEAA